MHPIPWLLFAPLGESPELDEVTVNAAALYDEAGLLADDNSLVRRFGSNASLGKLLDTTGLVLGTANTVKAF